MKKFLVLILSMSMLTVFFTACSGTKDGAQIVTTDGSSSMEKVIGYLSEFYMEQNTDTKITYNPTGSGSGIRAVAEGRCDIGLSSRSLKSEEEAQGLKGTVIAIDGIAVILNNENKITDLTIDEIAKIYTGEIENWSELGGEDKPIVCIGREAASGTRDGFESISDTEDKCKYSQELSSTGDVIQTVASNPNAIGYASLASVGEGVKLISVEGVVPSKETIRNGSYKIQRPFIMVTKSDSRLSEGAQRLFDFATSAEADELIEKAGAIPLAR